MASMYCYTCRKRRPTRQISKNAHECRFCCSQDLDFAKNLRRKMIDHIFAKDDYFYSRINEGTISMVVYRHMKIPLTIQP